MVIWWSEVMGIDAAGSIRQSRYHSHPLKQAVSEKALDDNLKIPTAMNKTANDMLS
jgi:hypothetical protein